jgi:cytochrome oxidase assembly protein ShyY1
MRNLKETKYFVDEVETQLREKPLRWSQTQDIHYSEDKTSYKVVALTYPWCSGRTLHSNV